MPACVPCGSPRPVFHAILISDTMSLPFPSSESSSATTEQTSTASETSATGKDGQSLQENLMRTSVCFSEQGAPTRIEAHPHSLCVPLPGWRCHFCTSMGKGSCSSIPPDGSYPISCPVPQRTVLVAETPISNPGRKLCSLRGRARAGNAPVVGALILLCQTALTARGLPG